MRKAVSQATFADLEFLRQGIQLDPVLAQISDFLDHHPELARLVEKDLHRGLKRAQTGRPGLTAEQTLRSFILWRIKDWPYRELRERIADGFTLRLFTRFGSRTVAKYQAFQRSFSRLRPETVGKRKWNKIEHRLFAFISMTWKGVPLVSYQTVVNLIAHTKTRSGLKVKALLDTKDYATGEQITPSQMRDLNLRGHSFHPDWNYTLSPLRTT